jgi:hypothetical protein
VDTTSVAGGRSTLPCHADVLLLRAWRAWPGHRRSAGNGKLGFAGEDGRMRSVLSRLFWRAIDPIVDAVEAVKCWFVDALCGPFPETPTDRAIGERGDRRFTYGPDPPRP